MIAQATTPTKKRRRKKKSRRLTRESFDKLRQQANDGDPDALAMLRRYLDEHEAIWQEVGDLAKHAQEAFIAKAAEGDQLVIESIRRHCDEMRRDLLGKRPTRAQKLAAERVVATWLEVNHHDRLFPEPTGTIAQASFLLRLKQSAQTRLDRALKSLVTLQKLQGEVHEEPAPPPRSRQQRQGRVAQPLEAGRVRLFAGELDPAGEAS